MTSAIYSFEVKIWIWSSQILCKGIDCMELMILFSVLIRLLFVFSLNCVPTKPVSSGRIGLLSGHISMV